MFQKKKSFLIYTQSIIISNNKNHKIKDKERWGAGHNDNQQYHNNKKL